MNRSFWLPGICAAASAAALALAVGISLPTAVAARDSWNPSAAAQRLDARQTWWMAWPRAQRDHDTACVSCHTNLPYAIGRPALRHTLGETGPSTPEQAMLRQVELRVNGWSDMQPFYNDAKSGANKSIESRGTEAVLNAFILARYDAEQHTLRPVTRTAFDNMWATQLKDGEQAGAWNWLNFHYSPWESTESQYYGATIAALAVGLAPERYAETPAIQPQLAALRTYLTQQYDAQPLANRVVVLWASTKLKGLLTKDQKQALVAEIESHQATDGGWTLSTLGTWKRRDNTEIDTRSDGYATGIVVIALREAGVSPRSPELKRAGAWLVKNQSATDGLWPAYSLNKNRDPASDIGQFMSDAATGYSAMALESLR